jgi:hypothetical protein
MSDSFQMPDNLNIVIKTEEGENPKVKVAEKRKQFWVLVSFRSF